MEHQRWRVDLRGWAILRAVMSAAESNPDSGKPLLLVDVDGVISLFGFSPDAPPEGEWLHVDGILHLCSAHAAQHLPDLGDHFELVWCTGWEEKANDYLPQWLGLPGDLPFLQFANSPPPSCGRGLQRCSA